MRAVDEEYKTFIEVRNKLAEENGLRELEEKYRELSKEPNLVEDLESLQKQIIPLQEEYIKEVNAILNEEVELNFPLILESEIEDIELSVGCVLTLSQFLQEEGS